MAGEGGGTQSIEHVNEDGEGGVAGQNKTPNEITDGWMAAPFSVFLISAGNIEMLLLLRR